jgi:hypothetical protein
VLRLIDKWLAAAGVIEDGRLTVEEQGSPQGGYVQLNINHLMSSGGLCAVLACWPW